MEMASEILSLSETSYDATTVLEAPPMSVTRHHLVRLIITGKTQSAERAACAFGRDSSHQQHLRRQRESRPNRCRGPSKLRRLRVVGRNNTD